MSLRNTWNGRVDDVNDPSSLRWHQVVEFDTTASAGDTVLVGYPSDTGVIANQGRAGACEGPTALRRAMASLPWTHTHRLIDSGDSQTGMELATDQYHYAQRVATYLNAQSRVVGLGGGHDIAWGGWQGITQAFPDSVIGIINIDAHLDLRPCVSNTSSGTPFRQIAQACEAQLKPFNYACLGVSEAANTPALFQYAQATNTHILHDIKFSADSAASRVSAMLQSIDCLYVTVCLDAFPSAYAPGVSAPAAVGVSPIEVIAFIRWLGQATRHHDIHWRYSDIAELNPSVDESDKTARLAARIAYELVNAMP